MPTQVTLDDVNKEKDFANVESVVDVAYDEAGSRLWYSVDNRVRNEKWTEVTLPGIGVFRSENADAANPTYELVRQDLVAGAYRDASGNVHFPVLDAQGSVRGYVTKSGLESAYDYYPYGTVVEVSPNGGDDNRRWQDKEFDNEHHKYYFGSRYFDPFFGMWMSPDPAGQFVNPYSYGGDPVNFVDPTGMWATGLGLVVGYDSNHGWNFGVGAAAEIGDIGFNASFSFNQDGSKSLNLNANASIPVFTTGLWLNAGLGFNLNSYTGASFSRSGGVCYGVSGAACAGVEVGEGYSWDRSGGFNGMAVYAEAYAQLWGGLAHVSTGYEAGLFGAEGRGLYAGGTLAGVHAELSHLEDGPDSRSSWGFEERVYYMLRNDGPDPKTGKPRKYVGLSIPSLGIFSDIFMYDHGNRNENQTNFKDRGQFEKEAKDKGLDYDVYPAWASKYHDPEKNVKMWMGRGAGIFNFLYGWFIIPSVEGVFDKNTGKTDYAKGPSYNYGNNFLSHFFLDIVPWKMMDVWFPNP